MKNFQFMAKLYGVRGSYPIASKTGTKIGGNTSCILFRTPNHVVIIDAGSGIINLGRDLIPEILKYKEANDSPFHITIIFTHTHTDHLQGFPFFAPIYIPGIKLHLFGPATLGVDFEDILGMLVEPQYHPVGIDELRAEMEFSNMNENMFIYFNPDIPNPQVGKINETEPAFSELSVYPMRYYSHPKSGTYIYRVEWNDKKIFFATDVEECVGGDQRLIAFSKNADVLIHDAQYTVEQYKKFSGFGHSSYAMACDTAKQAEVKKLLLYHHDPVNSDEELRKIEKEAKKLFPASELATESWEWIL